jgi:hypothetical protein
VKFASQLKSDEVMMALTIAALAYRVVDKFEHDITSIIYINWLEILKRCSSIGGLQAYELIYHPVVAS